MLPAVGRAWRHPSPTLARIFLVSAAIGWSFGGLFIKEIDTGALTIVFFRCFFSSLLLVAFLRGRRFPTRFDSSIAIFLFLALLVTFVASTKQTTAANAIFLQYTAPVYVVIAAPFILGEHVRRADVPALMLCLVGIAVLFLGNWGSGDALGLCLGAISGVFFGLFFVWLRRMRYADPVAITFISCLGVTVLLCVVPFVSNFDATALMLLAFMAVFQFAIPYTLFARGIAHVPGAEASLLALIEPVLNPIWVALFYGEIPSLATAIGGAIILLGLSLRYLVFRPPPDELPLEPAANVPAPIPSGDVQ